MPEDAIVNARGPSIRTVVVTAYLAAARRCGVRGKDALACYVAVYDLGCRSGNDVAAAVGVSRAAGCLLLAGHRNTVAAMQTVQPAGQYEHDPHPAGETPPVQPVRRPDGGKGAVSLVGLPTTGPTDSEDGADDGVQRARQAREAREAAAGALWATKRLSKEQIASAMAHVTERQRTHGDTARKLLPWSVSVALTFCVERGWIPEGYRVVTGDMVRRAERPMPVCGDCGGPATMQGSCLAPIYGKPCPPVPSKVG